MAVIVLTIFVSSCLAGIFVACFAAEARRSRHSSPERESLLPLADDAPATPRSTEHLES
jgi:hypothetical protein